MSDAAFESKVSGIFKRMEQRLGSRLSVEKAKAENLQSQDTRRTAFVLTEAIEDELKPAVKEALSIYDDAISRPMTPNERWEHIVTQQIAKAVEESVKQALALDPAAHPWKPLLSDEAPKLRTRLVSKADEHFERLGKLGARARRKTDPGVEWTMRLVMLAVGVLIGYLMARVIHH
jgi:hypothetical protein